MNINSRTTGRVHLLWKIPTIAFAYYLGVMISGGLITAVGMQWPAVPAPENQTTVLLIDLLGAFMVAICVALLASGLRGSFVLRWLILAAFTYVTFGLNNQIEAAIFTTFGGTETMIIFFILPCLLVTAVAALLFQSERTADALNTVFADQPLSGWWWRPIVVWLAFPVIYYFFGMLASPFVVPAYQENVAGLILPGVGTVIPVVLSRSALYLLVAIPILSNWVHSRRSLMLTLGVVYFAMMGLIGLLWTTFLPPVLRIVHSVEILGDGMVYAWLMIVLLMPKQKTPQSELNPATVD